MSEPGYFTCKAGFKHRPGEDCGHIVEERTPPPQHNFRIPKHHDTVVLNAANRVIRSYKLDGFYSNEQLALRRAENKLKYASQWKRERAEFEANYAPLAEVV